MSNNPMWLLLFFLLSISLGGVFYFWRSKDGFSINLCLVLAGLRSLLLFLLFLLLQHLVLEKVEEEKQEAELAVLFDQSSSIEAADTLVTEKLKGLRRQLKQQLTNRKLKFFGYTDSLFPLDSIRFDGLNSSVEQALSSVENYYAGKHLQEIVVVGDGVDTKIYKSHKTRSLDASVYAIALGDTLQKKELLIERMIVPRRVLKGNAYTVELKGLALGAAGETYMVYLKNGEDTIRSRKVTVLTDRMLINESFKLTADSVGIIRLVGEVKLSSAEENVKNNKKSSVIRVDQQSIKIDLVYDRPHPDLGYLRRVLEQTKQYSVELTKLEDWLVKSRGNFVIARVEELNALLQEELQDRLKDFEGAWINLIAPRAREASAYFPLTHQACMDCFDNSYVSDNQLDNYLGVNLKISNSEAPPFRVPSYRYLLHSGAKVLRFQQRKGFETSYPMLVYSNLGTAKILTFAGEGWWKIGMMDDATNEDLRRAILSLVNSVAPDEQNKLWVESPVEIIEGESCHLRVKVKDAGASALKEAAVKVSVRDSSGKEGEFEMLKKGAFWELDIPNLTEGEYDLRFDASSMGIRDQHRTLFVNAADQELMRLTVNQWKLKDICANGGKLYWMDNVEELIDEINRKGSSIKRRSRYIRQLPIDVTWLLLLALAMATVEWVLRKYNGRI